MEENQFVKRFIFYFLALYIVLAFVLNGTGDSGDSISHYLYGRYAFSHHSNFFDTWAKPLFVVLAAPFCQIGFIGIKFFNILNTVISAIATYGIAKQLKLSNAWFVLLIFLLAPLSFSLALSGLTEPLFATFLVCGLYLLFSKHQIWGATVLSFLPFVRSEGMFLLLPVVLYLLIEKRYASILFLTIGHLLYAIAGYFYLDNFFWFFTNNPYSVVSRYGNGEWTHYFRHLPIIAGPASCLLLAIGFFSIPITRIKNIGGKENTAHLKFILIWIIFSMYFFFHVIAWTFGLFASFGMTRIIVGVTPLIALLSLEGFNWLIQFMNHFKITQKAKLIHLVILFLLINGTYMVINLIYPSGTSGLNLTLCADQVIEQKMADYIKIKYPDYKARTMIYQAYYMSVTLDNDPFDTLKHRFSIPHNFPDKGLFIWDDWFSVIEGGVSQEYLNAQPYLVRDTAFNLYDPSAEKMRIVSLYKKK